MKCIFLTLLFITIFASTIGDAQHNKCLAPSNRVCRWIKVPRYVYDPQTGTCKRQMVCWFTGFPNKRRCEENCKDIINGATCASVQCAAGTVCTIENGAVRCVPSSSGTKPSRCLLPAEPGVCRAYMPSYFYNVETGKCEKFIYGGCGGNDNRFLTQQLCETVCMKDESGGQPTVTCANVRCAAGTVCTIENGAVRCVPSSSGTKPEKCLLPVDSGPCKAYMPSYFYNSATDSCELFIYGGCQGNANRFSSQKLCDSVCTENRGNGQQPSVTCASVRCPAGTVCTVINGVVHCAPSSAVGNKPEKCFLPAAPGPCEAYMPSYHYNSQTGRCVQFIYGGCQGNDNRFATQKWCERVCVHNQKCIVRTPPRPGCRFSHVRTGEDGCLVYGDLICDSIGQPSSCPKLPPGTVGICVERCSRDGDCNQGEKCCSNGCGHVCMRAV